MKLLDCIEIPGQHQPKRVELCQGDLTTLAPSEAFDLLIVSAFPDDYLPTRTSLIGALSRKGLSVALLAADKESDLRTSFSCWLSREFAAPDPGLRFRRILCFEPRVRGRPPEVVGDIFRALMPILAERSDLRSVAMPVVAAGNQGYKIVEMLDPLLDAALNWLERGLPLDCLKIVVYSEAQAQESLPVFSEYKAKRMPPPPDVAARQEGYDVFLSYSRVNARECEALERILLELCPKLRVFRDRNDIKVGAAWQPEIFESIDKCRKVVALLSPDYLSSKVCKEEFNIAWIRGRELDEEVIFPVYLYTAPLPTYMKYRNYVDCREGDEMRLQEASKRLLSALDGPK